MCRQSNPWKVWWLCSLLMLRALVPAGFMPAMAADGAFEFVICKAGVPVLVGDPTQQPGQSGDDTAYDDALCPFAGLASPSLMPAGGTEHHAAAAAASVTWPASGAALRTVVRLPGQGARAPPAGTGSL